MFVRGTRHRAVGRRRQPLPRLPVRARGHVARPLQPRRRRRRSPPGVDAAARQQLLRQPAGHRPRRRRVNELLADATGYAGTDVLLQLRRRGQRGRDQARPQVRRPRPARRRERVRQLPRAHARRARGHGAAGQARAVLADARGLPPRRVRRRRRAPGRRSTRRWPPCSSRRCRARAGSIPRRPATSRRSGELCDERGMLMMVDEVQTGLARTGSLVRVRARRRHARRRDAGQGDGQRDARSARAGPATDVATVFQPGDHGSTYSATALATAAVNAVIAEMRRLDAPALAAQRARGCATALRGDPRRRRRCAARGLLLAAELDRRTTRRRSTRRCSTTASSPTRSTPDVAALRAAAHGERRRDRRGGGDRRRRPESEPLA